MDKSAMMVFSALYFRFRLKPDTERWFVMTNHQIAKLTGLGLGTIIRAKKRLVGMGFIETSRGYNCCYFRITQGALDALRAICAEIKDKVEASIRTTARKIADSVNSSDIVKSLMVQFAVRTGKLPWRGYAQKWANTLAAAVKLTSPKIVADEIEEDDHTPGSVLRRLREQLDAKPKHAKRQPKPKQNKKSKEPERYECYLDEETGNWIAVLVK